jgi:hypothetical protein
MPMAQIKEKAANWGIGIAGPSPKQKTTIKAATVSSINQIKRLRGPFHDFFQMLLEFSSVFFIRFCRKGLRLIQPVSHARRRKLSSPNICG